MMKENALYLDLLEEIEGIPTIDAHEHLVTEEAHLREPHDFYSLFQHYCRGDLVACGATPEEMETLADRSRPLEERWNLFRPFLSRIRTGGYARSALLFIRDVLGFEDLDDDTFVVISAQLEAINTPGLYDRILRDRCNIVACIQCWRLGDGPFPDYFYHLAPSPEVVDLLSREAIDRLAQDCDQSICTLDDALNCLTHKVEQWAAHPKVVGIKSAHAYGRSIGFQKVSRQKAASLFEQILSSAKEAAPTSHDLLPLQDFLMFELWARAEAAKLPMVFHTGLQAGNYNSIANADPLLLYPLLREFPKSRVDLFHGGMPWVREIAVWAKYFPGVHLNMAWMHIINPTQARSALSEWLDMVPNNKIFGFGGDYTIVEKVYGHLTLARQNIAAVLAEKVVTGALSRSDATLVARRLLLENPRVFYGLNSL